MELLKNRSAVLALVCLVLMSVVSCDEEITTIGDGVIGDGAFVTGKEVFDVFAYNRDVKAVQVNKLPIYQLGVFKDGVYGDANAQITSQLQLISSNPTFGDQNQETEDLGDSDSEAGTFDEEETVTKVVLYIPYLTEASSSRDQDQDGVDGEFDANDLDPASDSDNDGFSDIQEKADGSNPLDAGSNGPEATDKNKFAKKVELDSIYGNREADFNIKVTNSTYYLRDLSPDSGFLEAQEYFSDFEYAPAFVTDILYDGPFAIDEFEYVFEIEDNPDTEENESDAVNRLAPGIRVELDNQYFQENLIDKEGASELLSQSNFKEFLRGIHLELSTEDTKGLMMLLDLKQANITVTYKYQDFDSSDNSKETAEKEYSLRLISATQTGTTGNAVNTFLNDDYPAEIAASLGTTENQERLYIKGAAGTFAQIKLFGDGNGSAVIQKIKENNWIINEASLVLYVDRNTLDNAGDNIVEPVRLNLYNYETNNVLYNLSNSINEDPNNPLKVLLGYGGIREDNADGEGVKYSFKITEHINNIIVRDSTNATLALAVTADIRNASQRNAMIDFGIKGVLEDEVPLTSAIDPTGTVLFGSNVSEENLSKKLQLVISYTEID